MKKTYTIFLITLVLIAANYLYEIFRHEAGQASFQSIYIIIMAITAGVIAVQSIATVQLTEQQNKPSVDVNMLYDVPSGKTYFWFYNSSAIPALVELKVSTKNNVNKISSLRIPPKKQIPNVPIAYVRRTASHYDFEKTELKLEVTVSSALSDGNKYNTTYTKNYHFNEKSQEWLENTWGFSDDPYPFL